MNTQNNTAVVRNLSDVALNAAIGAVQGSERAFFTATVSLATVMVAGQIDRLTGDLAIDDKKNRGLYRAFLKSYAFKGHVVWRGSEAAVEEIKSTVNVGKRREAASQYIDKKPKGSRLTDGLARLQTSSLQIADDVCKNHAGIIRELHQMKLDGADGTAQVERFKRFVSETYGDSAAKLNAYFAKPVREGQGKSAIQSVTDNMLKLSDLDLKTLAESIRAELERRKAEQDAADSFFDEASAEEGAAILQITGPAADPLAA